MLFIIPLYCCGFAAMVVVLYFTLRKKSQRAFPWKPSLRVEVPRLLVNSAVALRQHTDSPTGSRAEQLMTESLNVVKSVQPVINAVANERFNDAVGEAFTAAKFLQQTPETFPIPFFLGVPCSSKECFAFPGIQSTAGIVSRKGYRAVFGSPVVSRMRCMGFIPVGTTNLSELCMWYESSNNVYGRTNNPYNPERIVGGSSGGEAALIAAGGVPCGVGSDVGGSIRMPAYFNGVFGIKPTGGIVPNSGQFPSTEGLALRYLAIGPITRHSEDLAALYAVISGPDGEDVECKQWQLLSPPLNAKAYRLPMLSAYPTCAPLNRVFLPSCPDHCIIGESPNKGVPIPPGQTLADIDGETYFAAPDEYDLKSQREVNDAACLKDPWWARVVRENWKPPLHVLREIEHRNGLIETFLTATDPSHVDWSKVTVYNVPEWTKRGPRLCTPPEPSVIESVDKALAFLQSLGCPTAEFHMPEYTQAFDLWSATLGLAEPPHFKRRLVQQTGHWLTAHFLASLCCCKKGTPYTLPAIGLALIEDIPPKLCKRRLVHSAALADKLRQRLTTVLSGATGNTHHDPWKTAAAIPGEENPGVIILPVHPTSAPAHDMPLFRIPNFTYTALFNAMAVPAASAPVSLDPCGLPVGVQVIAAPGYDLLAIAVARQLEKGFGGWIAPPLIQVK